MKRYRNTKLNTDETETISFEELGEEEGEFVFEEAADSEETGEAEEMNDTEDLAEEMDEAEAAPDMEAEEDVVMAGETE